MSSIPELSVSHLAVSCNFKFTVQAAPKVQRPVYGPWRCACEGLLTSCVVVEQLYGPDVLIQPEDKVVLQTIHDMEWLATSAGRVVPNWVDNKTLWLFGPKNKIRAKVKLCVSHRGYQVTHNPAFNPFKIVRAFVPSSRIGVQPHSIPYIAR